MEDEKFREFFQKIVNRYEMDPDIAAELLQKILKMLKTAEKEPLQSGSGYEILIEHIEREEMP